MLKKKTAASKASENAATSAAARLAEQLDGKPGVSGSGINSDKPDNEKTVEQLVQKATAVHNDTTRTAQGALRKIEEMKEMKNNVLGELDKQNNKLEKIDNSMTQLNENLTYSEKILLYMRLCCCCWMFDSCTGADPEDKREKQWQGDVKSGKTAKASALYSRPDEGNGSGAKARRTGSTDIDTSPNTKGSPEFRNPDTALPEGHERAGNKLANETRKQNEIINQIDSGLDEILHGAKAINEELSRQDKLVDHVANKAEKNHDGLRELNNKSQLRDFKVPESQESDDFGAPAALKLLTKL